MPWLNKITIIFTVQNLQKEKYAIENFNDY